MGVVMKVVTKKDFIQSQLSVIFSSTKHADTDEKEVCFLHQVTIERWGRTEMITRGGGLKGVGGEGGVTRRGGCNMINMEISANIYFCSSNSSIVF
jgi:hypothetical protein